MRFRRSARTAMVYASLLMLALVLLGGPAGASGLADSPWPMYQHDPQHTGRSPYVGPENPAIRWRYEPKWSGLGSYVTIAADGTLYVPSSRLVALEGPTGDVKWEFGGFFGRSAPAVALDGTVYAGSSRQAEMNVLYALAPDGAIKWTFSVGGMDALIPGVTAGILSSPVIRADGAIYFGSTNGKVYAIAPDGTEQWSFLTDGRIDGSSPALGPDGTIYVGADDGNLYAIAPDGTEKWRFATRDWIGTSPVVAADGTIFVSSGGTVYSLSPSGQEQWTWDVTPNTDNFHLGTPAIGLDSAIYVGSSGGGIYALNTAGNLIWSFATDITFSTPIVDGNGTVYIGSRDDFMYAINADGTEKWRLNVGNDIDGRMAMRGDGNIYVVADNPTGKDRVLLIGERGSSSGIKASASMIVLAGVVAAGGLGLYLTRRRTGAR